MAAKGLKFSSAVMAATLVGWAAIELFFQETVAPGEIAVANVLCFPWITGLVAACIAGMLEAPCGKPSRMAGYIIGGFGVGFGATFLLIVPSQFLFNSVASVGSEASSYCGKGLFTAIVGRALSWSLLALPCGIAVGIVSCSWTRFTGCCCGALLGGVLGGAVFDPLSQCFGSVGESVWICRMTGFSLMAAVTAGIVFITESSDR